MRLGISVLAALLLAAPAQAAAPKVACTDSSDRAIPLTLPVYAADAGATQDAFGYYALPAKKAKGIVVFAHGHGNSAYKWRENLQMVARELGVIAVAMDYRRQTYPKGGIDTESYGWRVREGAEDSIAAGKLFESTCQTKKRGKKKKARRLPIIMFGVSMGGNTSGLAIAHGARRKDGSPLFDWWFDVEGVTNVIETYLEARAVAGPPLNNRTGQIAVAEIEEEMGGPLEARPDVYAEHSVVTRADDIKASGLKGVVMVHGADDGTVPYNQSPEMFARLVEQRIPTDFFTVLRRAAGQNDGQTAEETLTIAGYIPGYASPFAGHGGENDLNHPVIKLAFERLALFFEEDRKPRCYRKVLYDDGKYQGDESASLPPCSA